MPLLFLYYAKKQKLNKKPQHRAQATTIFCLHLPYIILVLGIIEEHPHYMWCLFFFHFHLSMQGHQIFNTHSTTPTQKNHNFFFPFNLTIVGVITIAFFHASHSYFFQNTILLLPKHHCLLLLSCLCQNTIVFSYSLAFAEKTHDKVIIINLRYNYLFLSKFMINIQFIRII